jgi:RNA polymerase sigma factor (sigma-70 family)
MIDDASLLRRYATDRAEDAFAEFVRRHLPLVYSAALRRLGGDAHAAEDVAQLVFCAAARDAHRLSQHATLTGWLYTTTRNAVIDRLRSDHRRRAREQEATMLHEISPEHTSAADWGRLGPVLDDAMDDLNRDDREAVLLRFFENLPYAEIGAGLGLSEEATRKRVVRALEKLGDELRRRGIASTSAALAVALGAGSAAATPAGLAASITSAALATGSTAVAAAAAITVSKIHVGIAAVVIAGAATGLVTQQRAIRSLRETTANAEQQFAQLTARQAALVQARTEAETKAASAVTAEASARAEVERLRSALSAVQPPTRTGTRVTPASPASPAPSAAPQSEQASPDALGPLPDTPEIRQRQAAWHRRYDPFFLQRGMTAAQGDRFVELKIHQEIARADFQAAVRSANLRGDSRAVQALRANDDSPVTRGLRELLGPEGYAAYGAYEISSSYRMVYVEPAQAELTKAGMSLSTNQSERLLAIFAANARHIQAHPTDIGTTGDMDWNAVIAQAAAVLSPAQLTTFQAYAQRRASASHPAPP